MVSKEGRGRRMNRVRINIYPTTYNIDKQQEPIVYHRELTTLNTLQ